MDDFNKEVKQKYDDLEARQKQLKRQLIDIGKTIKPLRLYLVEAGIIEKKVKTQKVKVMS